MAQDNDISSAGDNKTTCKGSHLESPRMKQGKISGYFSTRRQPTRSAKAVVTTTSTSIGDKEDVSSRVAVGGGLVSGELLEDVPRVVSKRAPVLKRKVEEPILKVDTPVSADPQLVSVAEPFSVTLTPAHERFSDLLQSSTSATRLILPESLQLLSRIHVALEAVCQLAADRDQPAIFHRIKKAAENIVGRTITESHVQQIHHLTPEDFLTFRPVPIVHQGKRITSFAIEFPSRLSQGDLVGRREKFHAALLDHVKGFHSAFLEKEGIKLPEGAKLRSWHPKFDLASAPEVPCKELFPVEPNAVTTTTKGTINKGAPLQIKDVIRETEASRDKQKEKDKTCEKTCDTLTRSSPKKEPLSLLERIKAKEQKKQTEEMLHPSKETRSTSLLQELSELMESLCILFAGASKTSLPLADITTKLGGLGTRLVASSPDEIHTRVRRLAELVPEWIQVLTAGQAAAVLVKIDRRIGIKEAQRKLAAKFAL